MASWADRALVAAWLLAACAGGKDATDTPPDDTSATAECTDLTWQNFASGYVRTWCGPCHSSTLSEGERYGAPLEVNFDDLAAVRLQAGLVSAYATGADPLMPPAGGPSPEAVLQLTEWLDCGLPGDDVPDPVPCQGSEHAGDLTLDGPDACAGISSVAGDVTITADVDLDCLCHIGGDLRVDGTTTTVTLHELGSVDGDLVVTDATALQTLDLPDLDALGGGLVVDAHPTLREVLLQRVDTVGGALAVRGTPVLETVRLPQLESVGAELAFEDNAALRTVELSQLDTVGGDLLVRDNAALATVSGDFYSLTAIGGDLRFVDNPELLSVYGFNFVTQLGGSVEISGNPEITDVFGFDLVERVTGDLTISDNALLQSIAAFEALTEIDGSLTVTDNALVGVLSGFPNLQRVGVGGAGAVVVARNGQLADVSGLDALVEVGGLELSDNGLVNLNGLGAVTTISGDVILSRNTGLMTVLALQQVSAVTGDVVVTGQPDQWAMDLLSGVQSIGGDLSLTGLGGLDFFTPMAQLQTLGGDLEIGFVGTTDLAALAALTSVGGHLDLHDNPQLLRLTDLGIDTVGGDVRVTDNPVLPTQEADDLVTRIGLGDIGGVVEISGNQ